MPSFDKNPVSPHALTFSDMQAGRVVILFNTNAGVTDEGVIMSRPYLEPAAPPPFTQSQRELVIDFRSMGKDEIKQYRLKTIGVIPETSNSDQPEPVWSDCNFVVYSSQRSQLPEPTGFPAGFLDKIEDDLAPEDLIQDNYED